MRVGYPCLNLSIGCSGSTTFRLKSYSDARLIAATTHNLSCLVEMLKFNVRSNMLHFRISSDIVPLASHPVCTFTWQDYFRDSFRMIGRFARKHGMRLSMHPGQYTLLNSPHTRVHESTVADLKYHCQVLDLMQMSPQAKVQVHVGGVYGNKEESMRRFIERYTELDADLRKRLVIENDDRCYSAADCLKISRLTGIPIVFDTLHHEANSGGIDIIQALKDVSSSWKRRHGPPIVDYSSQEHGGARGRHAQTVDVSHFGKFLKDSRPLDFDIMMEIKDKEKSVLRIMSLVERDNRFVHAEVSAP